MNGHSESTAKASSLSSDSVRRVTQYQAAGINARLKLFALLEAQGVPAAGADGLWPRWRPGRSARWLSWTAWPASSGPGFEDGWDEGVMAVSAALVGIADRDWSRRGGRSAGAAELPMHLADVRQRERTDLARLEEFVRGRAAAHAPEHHRAAPGRQLASRGRGDLE
ncbi:hypothetical protein IPZ61_32185 [Streptomyces sioyaensis]|uniref:hypothetical protein n=1 Tax=Streptomyces sioyaensis TaxID=67364 RepID=UPI001F40692D|nr:hypothetical protein [Streptomyces sioyaensis]MCF3177959.1 hypothetical protein [Streptomyces sioyaensis]